MKITILIVVVFLFSCKGQKELSSNKDCIGKLKTELLTNWKYNVDSAYYQTPNDFLQRFDTTYKFCLYNLPKDSIIRILGKPTGGINNYFEYLVSKPCARLNKPGTTKCTQLRFFVNDSNNVSTASIHYIVGSGQK